MIILGVDVETSTNDESRQVLEIGLVLFDTLKRQSINILGRILPVGNWCEETAKIHKIDKNLADSASKLDADPYDVVDANKAEYIIAHNATFDKPLIVGLWPRFGNKRWICTQRDLNHESKISRITSHRLGHLSTDYGIPVVRLHRAVDDAELACHIASFHDLNHSYEEKLKPHYNIFVSGKFNREYGDRIKRLKFRWNPDEKTWYKERVCQSDLKDYLICIRDEMPGWNPSVVENNDVVI